MFFYEMRENMKRVYARASFAINAFFKFLLVFDILWFFRLHIGSSGLMRTVLVTLAISVLACFFPCGVICLVLWAVMLIHVYLLIPGAAVMVLAVTMIIFLLYMGLRPGCSVGLLLVPAAFSLGLTFAVPIIMGLVFGLAALVPVIFGTVIYFFIIYLGQDAAMLAGSSSMEGISICLRIIRDLCADRDIIIYMASFAVCIVIVSLISRLAFDHSKTVAAFLGGAVQLAAISVGIFLTGSDMPAAVLAGQILAGTLIAFICNWFAFAVDYSRVENLTFEDDEYVYYVRAVPKIAVSRQDVQVQRIDSETE